jgi:acyl transferase domain-containing protein
MADWFYIPSWKRTMPPAPYQPGDLTGRKSCWLVFTDAYGVGTHIVQRLQHDAQDVITVRVGKRFDWLSERAYAVNPRRQQDYIALLKTLCSQGQSPRQIVHCWSVTPDDQALSGHEFFATSQDLGYYSLLFLTHALANEGLISPFDIEPTLRIVVFTSGLHAVTDTEVSYPEKATLLGPCKVIPQEYPAVTCQCIDVMMPAIGTPPATTVLDRLMAEIGANSPDMVLAYRGAQRWVQTFEATSLSSEAKRIRSLRHGGVYLITGGLGEMGLVLAAYLVRIAQAKLLLV